MSNNLQKTALPPEPRQNRILASLPAKDYARLLPDLKLVDMPLRWTVSESGDHVNFLHFPVSGIVSLIYTLEDGSSSETALVGNEGLVGISIFMGGESMPTSTEVSKQVHELIDYYYEPEIAAEVAAYVQYVTPVAGAREAMEQIDPELASNTLIFPDEEMSARIFDMRSLTSEEDNRYTQAYQKALGN